MIMWLTSSSELILTLTKVLGPSFQCAYRGPGQPQSDCSVEHVYKSQRSDKQTGKCESKSDTDAKNWRLFSNLKASGLKISY